MSNKRDKIIAIFIEESTEIIEKLESEIMLLDESPWDKAIINEIFRGVHTLKGNANSFGFTNLGNFVHYFEDLLDYYRDPNRQPNKMILDLLFDAFDVIKQVFSLEKNGHKEYPENYTKVLDDIKNALNIQSASFQEVETLENVVKKTLLPS